MVFEGKRGLYMSQKIKCCKDCARREVGCHSFCEVYQKEKAIYEAQCMDIRRKKHDENNIRGFKIEQILKIHREKQRER